MKLVCECNSFDCNEQIEISAEETSLFMRQNPRPVVISNDCKTGPDSTDVLLEEKATYKLYKEKS